MVSAIRRSTEKFTCTAIYVQDRTPNKKQDNKKVRLILRGKIGKSGVVILKLG